MDALTTEISGSVIDAKVANILHILQDTGLMHFTCDLHVCKIFVVLVLFCTFCHCVLSSLIRKLVFRVSGQLTTVSLYSHEMMVGVFQVLIVEDWL